MDVFVHYGHSLGMDGTQICIFKKTNQVMLCSLLESQNSMTLKPQFSPKILCNFTDQSLKRQLSNEKFCALLVFANLTKGNCTRTITSFQGWPSWNSGQPNLFGLNGPVRYIRPDLNRRTLTVSSAQQLPLRSQQWNSSWLASMAGGYKKQGYAWAVSAGLNAALAAISAKFFQPQLVRYGLVILFNAIMWGCYVNSLKALSSLQATVTNFATNFLSSGLAGFFLFEEALQYQWFLGAALIVIGVIILSKSSKEEKSRTD